MTAALAHVRSLGRRLPAFIQKPLQGAMVAPRAFALGADLRSALRLIAIWLTPRSAAPRRATRVRLRPLACGDVYLRPGAEDGICLRDTFELRAHLPPASVAREAVRTVWDLGANIGLTMADLALHCPQACIIGVELDPDNARLCRRNIARFGERCELLEAAVWPSDGRVGFVTAPGHEQATRVSAERGAPSASAMSLDSLLQRTGADRIDYVKMDIEGAEREVLRERTGWAQHVASIRVEVHPPYTVERCSADLRALGFRTAPCAAYTGCVEGVREPVTAGPSPASSSS